MTSTTLAVDWSGGVSEAWARIATFVPKLFGFLVILVVGYLVAKALQKATDAVLERVGFDRAVERGGVAQALARSRYDASDVIAKLVYYAVLLITLVIAFNTFGPNPISALLAGVIAFLPKLVVAILIVVVVSAIAKAVKDIIEATLGGLSYGRVLANLASVFILALGIIAALNQVGIATAVTTPVLITVLATVGGILVVGVGGGLVAPMQRRWEQWLSHAENETQNVRAQVQANRGAAGDVLGGYADQARAASGSSSGSSGSRPGATAMGTSGGRPDDRGSRRPTR